MAEGRRRSHGYAFLVAAGILLSRIAGLIRERAFAHYFGGTSIAAGAFRAGLRIPNILQNLFGEGVLSASFIPVYTRLLAEGDRQLAGRVAGAVAAILGVFISAAVALGVILTPWIVDLIVPGFHGEARQLTVEIVRILFPGMGLLVLSAWCLGILNSHRQFFLSYAAPVLWNAAMIATMVVFGTKYGQAPLAVALAWGTVAGAFLQLAVQIPFVFRHAKQIRFALALSLAPVRTVVRNTGPAVLGRGVVQVSSYIDQLIASFLHNGTGAVSILGYAQTIYLLPVSLFGMSVAAAELPLMSSSVGTPEEIAASLRERLAAAVRQVAFFIIPTIVGFILFGHVLVAALYQTGHFGRSDSTFVWYVLCGASVGLFATTRGRIYNSAFYSLHDTRTPLRFAVARVAAAAGMGYLLAFPFRPAIAWIFVGLAGLPAPGPDSAALVFGAAGVTLSSGIAGWIEYLLLRAAIAQRIGEVRAASGHSARLWGSALAAGAATLAALRFLIRPACGAAGLGDTLQAVLTGAGALAVFAAVYLAAARLSGIEEARRLPGTRWSR